jgi:CRISPR-associated protein Csb3
LTPEEPDFKVNVDVTNPGQFFACCGLLELSHRLWPGAEGYFQERQFAVNALRRTERADIRSLFKEILKCNISGLSASDREALNSLERQKKARDLSPEEEEKRIKLGKMVRRGSLTIGKPFGLLLDWWNAGDDERGDAAIPKTWAGRQEIEKIAVALQNALSEIKDSEIKDLQMMFDYNCVIRKPNEDNMKSGSEGKVEAFYFDDRRFADRLDAGFSLDALKLESVSYPAVELLCLIGLQRFRPSPTTGHTRSFDYYVWTKPLGVTVGMAVVCGAIQVAGSSHYRFSLRPRDDQKRYKAFGKAVPVIDKT